MRNKQTTRSGKKSRPTQQGQAKNREVVPVSARFEGDVILFLGFSKIPFGWLTWPKNDVIA